MLEVIIGSAGTLAIGVLAWLLNRESERERWLRDQRVISAAAFVTTTGAVLGYISEFDPDYGTSRGWELIDRSEDARSLLRLVGTKEENLAAQDVMNRAAMVVTALARRDSGEVHPAGEELALARVRFIELVRSGVGADGRRSLLPGRRHQAGCR